MPLIPDSPFILNPSGLVSYPSWPTSGNFGNVSPHKVSTPVPGQALAVFGSGTFDVTAVVSGRQGSIRVSYVTGAAGSSRALAFLAQSSTVLLGVALDSSNRPYAILKDAYGTTVGQSSTSGDPAVASGVPGEVTLSWNSKGVVFNGRYASFVTGALAADWGTAPVAAWDQLIPASLLAGTSLGALSLSDFNGTLVCVSVGNQVVPVPAGTDASEVLQATGSFAGAAAVSASVKAIRGVSTTMAGSAAVSASATGGH